jgi:3-oxoacyl-[acyl-carrier-protein] synthase II
MDQPVINNTKSFIGHAMGRPGRLELAGNLPSLTTAFAIRHQRGPARPRMCGSRAWFGTSRGRGIDPPYPQQLFWYAGINSVVIIGLSVSEVARPLFLTG